jgi:pimeloyl-ACP methyl ester carboxylesterase
VLLANGDDDRMLPTPNIRDMARRLPNNELVIYPDAGHGGISRPDRSASEDLKREQELH